MEWDGFRLAMLLIATVLSTGCAKQVAATDAAASEETSPAAVLLTAQQLESRLLDYAVSVNSPEDVTANRFADVTQAKFVPYGPGQAGGTARGQALAHGYMFNASFATSDNPKSIPMHQVFIFAPGGRRLTERSDSPCLWEASSASSVLTSEGFAHTGNTTYKGSVAKNYRRSLSDGLIEFDAKLLTYESIHDGSMKTCVWGMHFSGGAA